MAYLSALAPCGGGGPSLAMVVGVPVQSILPSVLRPSVVAREMGIEYSHFPCVRPCIVL